MTLSIVLFYATFMIFGVLLNMYCNLTDVDKLIAGEMGPLKSRGVSHDLGATVHVTWSRSTIYAFHACFRLLTKGRPCFNQNLLATVHV